MIVNFKKILHENLLLEDRIQFLQKKYEKLITPEIFEKLKDTDPTTNKQYLQWIIEKYLKLNSRDQILFTKEDYTKTNTDLTFFNNFKQKFPLDKRDINKFKDFVELYNVVKPLKDRFEQGDESILSQSQQSDKIKKDIIKVFENSNYLIVIPKTHESSCLIGSGTRWCTATKDSSRDFDSYNREGSLFIIIHKNVKDSEGRQEKYQFHFESGQFMDEADRRIDLSKYINENPDVAGGLANYLVQSINDPITIVKYLTILKRTDLISDDIANKIKNIDVKPGSGIGFDILYGLFKANKFDAETVNKLSKDNTIFLDNDGSVYAIFNDWSDEKLPEFFSNNNRNDYQNAAKQIFAGETWEWFSDYDAYTSLSELGNSLDEKTINKIKEILIKQGHKKKAILSLGESDLLNYIDENDLDDIKTSILHGANDAYSGAMEGAYWKAYTNALIDLLGPHKFVDSKLMFKTDFDYWIKEIITLSDYESEGFDYNNYTSWLVSATHESGNEIRMREEYYDSPTQEDTNVMIRERLTEIS